MPMCARRAPRHAEFQQQRTQSHGFPFKIAGIRTMMKLLFMEMRENQRSLGESMRAFIRPTWPTCGFVNLEIDGVEI
jgi:hypothetical protein